MMNTRTPSVKTPGSSHDGPTQQSGQVPCAQDVASVPHIGALTGVQPAPKPAPTLVDKDYRRWISERPCVACLTVENRVWYPAEPAHVHGKRNAGDEANLLPLCAEHHRTGPQAFHRIGVQSFARLVGFDLEKKAQRYWEWYVNAEQLAF